MQDYEAIGVAERELGDVDGMEAVHVLARVDGLDDGALVDVRRGRRLDEDAVNGGVGVERLNERDEFGLRSRGGQFVLYRVHAEFVAHLVLRPHIGARSGVVAHEHDGEAGDDAPRFQGLGGGFARGVRFLGDGFSVNERHESR